MTLCKAWDMVKPSMDCYHVLMRRHFASLALLLLPLAAPGCGKSAPSEGSAASSPPTSTRADTSGGAVNDKRGAELEVSKPKDYKPAADGPQLGTLPDGIGIPVGAKAPAFETKDADGKSVTLDALVGKGDVLLVFYRGGW